VELARVHDVGAQRQGEARRGHRVAEGREDGQRAVRRQLRGRQINWRLAESRAERAHANGGKLANDRGDVVEAARAKTGEHDAEQVAAGGARARARHQVDLRRAQKRQRGLQDRLQVQRRPQNGGHRGLFGTSAVREGLEGGAFGVARRMLVVRRWRRGATRRARCKQHTHADIAARARASQRCYKQSRAAHAPCGEITTRPRGDCEKATCTQRHASSPTAGHRRWPRRHGARVACAAIAMKPRNSRGFGERRECNATPRNDQCIDERGSGMRHARGVCAASATTQRRRRHGGGHPVCARANRATPAAPHPRARTHAHVTETGGATAVGGRSARVPAAATAACCARRRCSVPTRVRVIPRRTEIIYAHTQVSESLSRGEERDQIRAIARRHVRASAARSGGARHHPARGEIAPQRRRRHVRRRRLHTRHAPPIAYSKR
jgi:hypothetical protein